MVSRVVQCQAGKREFKLRGYPETMLGKTVYLLDSERLSPQQRSALLY
jgi:hypothetical protein